MKMNSKFFLDMLEKQILSCIAKDDELYEQFVAEIMQDKDLSKAGKQDILNECEGTTFSCEESALQVIKLLRLANKFFIIWSHKETLLLAALHTAELASDLSEAYEELPFIVAEYIRQHVRYSKSNFALCDAIDDWIEDQSESIVIDLVKYKETHGIKTKKG